MRSTSTSSLIYSVFTVLVLQFGLILHAHAQTAIAPNGSGTASNPYQIASLENLYWVTQNSSSWDKVFQQTADIDASVTSGWSDGGWTPIALDGSFTGVYDGGGYTISGIYSDKSNTIRVGLFSVVGSGAEVKNLILTDIFIRGRERVGGVTGDNYGTINNVRVSGQVQSNQGQNGYSNAGGVAGRNVEGGRIQNSHAVVNVSGPGYHIGGLVGINRVDQINGAPVYSWIIGSSSHGTVLSGGERVGGLLGNNQGFIFTSFSSSRVNNSDLRTNRAGGFVGWNTGAITGSYATGDVYGASEVGGFVGYSDEGTITTSYSTGFVSGTGSNVGGFGGLKDEGEATNGAIYWNTTTSGTTESAFGRGRTDEEMRQASTFTDGDWDFSADGAWAIQDGMFTSFPYLKSAPYEQAGSVAFDDTWAMPGLAYSDDSMVLEYDLSLTSGTTIALPLYGTVNAHVDWGDGTLETVTTSGDLSHTYAENDTYTVRINGTVTTYGKWTQTYDGKSKLTRVISFGDLGTTKFLSAFKGANNLTDVPSSLPSTVTTIQGMFTDATKFNDPDVVSWDLSNVTSIARLFYGATTFNQDVSGWNVSNVTGGFGLTFKDAEAFNQPIGAWNVSNGTYMVEMFSGATSFNQDLGNWDVSNVTNMTNMFAGTAMSTENYSATLVGWAAKAPVQNDVRLDAPGISYNQSASDAHDLLTGTYNWTINDGGFIYIESRFGVTLISPLASIAGKPIAIFGSEFGSSTGAVSVKFKDAVTGQVVSTVNPTSITNGIRLNVSTPDLAGGNYKIEVSVNGSSYTYPKIFTVLTQGRVFEKRVDMFGARFSDMEVQDFNGDGHYDILIQGVKTYFYDRQSRLYLGDGQFGFTRNTAIESILLPLASGDLTTGDADMDGDLDLLQTGSTNDVNTTNARTRLYINTGGGAFQVYDGFSFKNVKIGSSDFVDIDGDGDLDIVLTGEDNSRGGNTIVYPYQAGQYSSADVPGFRNYRGSGTDIGDQDGDGDLDILVSGYVGTSSGQSGYMINQGSQNNAWDNFYLSGLNLTDAVARYADIDMDGNPELFYSGRRDASSAHRTYIYGYNPLNRLLEKNNYVSNADFGDYDADGDQDLLLDWISDYAFTLLENSSGWPNVTDQVGLSTHTAGKNGDVRFADLDGDGDLDVIVTGARDADDAGGRTFIYENKPFRGGDGSYFDPYAIYTYDDLVYLSENPQYWDKDFYLAADIDASASIAARDQGQGFSPIGNSSTPFTGIFNGANHKIENLAVTSSSEAGLFGVFEGFILNLAVTNASIVGGSEAGAIAGVSSGNIVFSYSTGAIQSSDVSGNSGGLVGRCEECTIQKSFSSATVANPSGGFSGGLIGASYGGTVIQTYATGSVTDDLFAGGLIGVTVNGSVTKSYATGSVTDTDSNSPSGGLVGGNDTGNPAEISSSFFSRSGTGMTKMVGTTNGSSDEGALSDVEMIWSDRFEDAEWNFSETWDIQADSYRSYPYLRGISYDALDTTPSVLPIPGLTVAKDPMVFTINTSLVEGVQAFDLPLKGDMVDVRVDWGDGNVSFYQTAGEKSHEYADESTRTIKVYGQLDAFSPTSSLSYPMFSAPMITGVTSFGDLGLKTLNSAFSGAVNLITAPPILPSTITSLVATFAGATSFNGDITQWNIINVNTLRDFLNGASSFNQNLGDWDITGITDMTGMLENTALTTSNYDAILFGWASQTAPIKYVTLDVGSTKYSSSGIEARQILIEGYEWTINDGGLADEIAPTLSGFSPLNGAVDLSRKPNLMIRFSEAVNVVDGVGISLKNLSTLQTVETNYTHSTGLDSVVFTPKDSLAASSRFAVQISASAITDTSGNAFAGIIDTTTWTFTTEALPIDTTGNGGGDDGGGDGGGGGGGDSGDGGGGTSDPVTIASLTPAHNTTGVPTTQTLSITFSDTVLIGDGQITLYRSSSFGTLGSQVEQFSSKGDQISGAGSKTLRFTLQNPLEDQSVYSVTIQEGAFKDRQGQNAPGVNSLDWSFQTADETAPRLASLTPTNGATSVSTSPTLQFNFNEAVNAQQGELTVWHLEKDTLVEAISITGSGVTKVDAATFRVTLQSKLTETTQYYVLIDAESFSDAAGNRFAGLTKKNGWTFTTADETAPTLRSTSPVNGQKNVSLEPTLVMQFNETVQAGTGSLKLYRTSDQVLIAEKEASSASYSGSTVTFAITSELDQTTSYYVTLDAGAVRDASGNSHGGMNSTTAWSFTTASKTFPILESKLPESGAEEVSLTPTLQLTFSKAVYAGTDSIKIIRLAADSASSESFNTGSLILNSNRLDSLTKDSVVWQIAADSSIVEGYGSTALTISLSDSLPELSRYAILIGSEAFVDQDGNAYSGIQSKEEWTFKTENDPSNDPPTGVTLLSPENQSEDQSLLLTFQWSKDSLATSYQIQIEEAGAESGSLLDQIVTDTSLVVIQGLEYATTYEWHVKAINEYGESDWSRMFTFRTQQEPIGTTRLTRPENGAEDIDIQPTFEWQSVQGAEWYDLQLSKRSDFSILSLNQTGLTQNRYTLEDELDQGTVYYWRVRSGNDGKISSWSTPHMFRTEGNATSVEEFSGLPREITLLQNYPNPFNPSTQIRFGLPQASDAVSLAIYTMTGQRVASLYQNARLQAGWHEVTFRADHLPSGTYLILFRAGQVQQTRLLTLIK